MIIRKVDFDIAICEIHR